MPTICDEARCVIGSVAELVECRRRSRKQENRERPVCPQVSVSQVSVSPGFL